MMMMTADQSGGERQDNRDLTWFVYNISTENSLHIVGHKNVPLYFDYLSHFLVNFYFFLYYWKWE